MTAEQNYRLLLEIEANRNFILMAYQQNPALLARADSSIRQAFGLPQLDEAQPGTPAHSTAGPK